MKYNLNSACFEGTFSCDEFVPLKKRGIQCYIVNTGRRSSEGYHWIAIYRDIDKRKIFYFDSLASPIMMYKELYKNHILYNFTIIYVNRRIQGIISSLCGHYAVTFLIHMLKYKRTSDFYHLFNVKNTIQLNDRIVCNYITQRYPFARYFCGV